MKKTHVKIPKRLEQLVVATSLLIVSIIVGTMIFMYVENYNLREAFYMTILAISTVGFGEVRPLSPKGQIFTSFYIIFNLSIFAYFLSVISKYLFEGELQEILNRYMSSRNINKLKNHVIVCGYGRNGFRACEELRKDNVDFVVIDVSEKVFNERFDDKNNTHYVIGDASEEKVLQMAGVENAKALIASMPDDAMNVFVSLTAKELNPNIVIIARASRASSEQKLLRAGADHVVMPDVMGGHYMATLIQRPQVVAFLDMINGVNGVVKLHLEEFTFHDLKPMYKGKSIREMDVRRHIGVTILGYRGHGKEFIFNPVSDTVLQDKDVFIILGETEQLERFQQKYLQEK